MQDHQHDLSDPGHTHPYQDHHGMDDPNFGNALADNHVYYHSGQDYERTTSSHTTGVKVTGVSGSYRHGEETRPKNMNVIYIIRVY